MDAPTEEKLLVGYRAVAEFLTDQGYPLSKSTMAKYGSPAINIGPPAAAYWGKLPAFLPSRVLAWAKDRLRPVDAVRAKLAATSEARSVAESNAPSRDAMAQQSHPAPRRRGRHVEKSGSAAEA
jgi:hypothetical protein